MIDAAMISYEKKIKKIKSAVIILELGTLGHIYHMNFPGELVFCTGILATQLLHVCCAEDLCDPEFVLRLVLNGRQEIRSFRISGSAHQPHENRVVAVHEHHGEAADHHEVPLADHGADQGDQD